MCAQFCYLIDSKVLVKKKLKYVLYHSILLISSNINMPVLENCKEMLCDSIRTYTPFI